VGGSDPALRFRFDRTVADNGYIWWYLDALSDDGRYGITVIAFLGAVFSPYYLRARKNGVADPLDHPAMNVVLYGPDRKRWALTERRRSSVSRDAHSLSIGPSAIHWDGNAINVEFSEITMPIPGRLKGRVRLHPSGFTPETFSLDAEGRHSWWPIAPCSRVEVELDSPKISWSGPAYFDTNYGSRALEDDFTSWNWSRAPVRDGAAVLYDVLRKDGTRKNIALACRQSGETQVFKAPATTPLPKGPIWRMERETRSEGDAEVVKTLEDTPFYTRSELRTTLLGERTRAMHESLSMPRFTSPFTQILLPFRMPRTLR
jgi:carotenoid 1,2-hydratase